MRVNACIAFNALVTRRVPEKRKRMSHKKPKLPTKRFKVPDKNRLQQSLTKGVLANIVPI